MLKIAFMGAGSTVFVRNVMGDVMAAPALREGDIRYLAAQGGLLAFTRSGRGQTLLCACNAGSDTVQLPLEGKKPTLLAGTCGLGQDMLTLSGVSAAVLLLEG